MKTIIPINKAVGKTLTEVVQENDIVMMIFGEELIYLSASSGNYEDESPYVVIHNKYNILDLPYPIIRNFNLATEEEFRVYHEIKSKNYRDTMEREERQTYERLKQKYDNQ